MKMSLMAATAAAVALTAVPASAQQTGTQVYGNLGYAHYDADGLDLGAVQGRLGARFGQYFGVEGEAAVGVDDDAGVDLNHSLGIYAVGYLPVGQNFDLLARVGGGMTEVDTPVGDFDDESLNYGVGAQWHINEGNAIRGDWTRMDSDTVESDVWSLSYVRKF